MAQGIGESSTSEELSFWFVGAYYNDRLPPDQLDRFLEEGIWENGFDDQLLDQVRSMRAGDKIAVKSTYTRKNRLPFDNHENFVSVMAIRATGTITANHQDGKRVDVDWDPVPTEPREWYFHTHRSTLWKVAPSNWMGNALIRFTFDGEEQDLDAFRMDPFWKSRYGTTSDDAPPAINLEWTQFYGEFATQLLKYKDRRADLLELIRGVAAETPHLGYLLNDRQDQVDIAATDICPLTVMGSFNRGVTNHNRTLIARNLGAALNVEADAPTTFDAIPILNTQNSRFFESKDIRKQSDIDTLWDVFEKAIQLVDNSEDTSRDDFILAYDEAQKVSNVSANLTMALFWIRPWNYVSLDSNTRSYITNCLEMSNPMAAVRNGSDYLQLLSALELRFHEPSYPVHSFPEMSLTAYFYQPETAPEPVADADPEIDDPTQPVLLSPAYTLEDIQNEGSFLEKQQLQEILSRWKSKKNLILQGPPGTGKTWLAKRLAYALSGTKHRGSTMRSIQFHPNMSYEDFVRGWRPSSSGNLELIDGPFLELIKDAAKDPERPYVMVIEEINRGNPVQLFGEMMTLIESSKRSPEDALQLSYARTRDEMVHVPENVYIIGTMNLADRSLGIIDLAFRRRFAFENLEPQIGNLWKTWVDSHAESGTEVLDAVRDNINEVNTAISEDPNLGPHFQIGHSFITPPQNETIYHYGLWYRSVVRSELEPLLDEYWFDDTKTAGSMKARLLANVTDA
jgi:5-methylcytosine-specific restriction protein B